jgi:hypothetical protein
MTEPIKINGKELKCLFCGGSQFGVYNTLLNKKWLAMLDWEWLSPKEGKAYVCKNCGYKQEFFSKG